MRMTDSNSNCIGDIVRLGDCWQVKQLAHHIAYLLFASSPIPRHRQLHLTGSVLSDRDSPLLQEQNRDTARLCNRYSRGHIFAEEECLNSCLCWLVLGNDLAQLLIDLLQTSRVG